MKLNDVYTKPLKDVVEELDAGRSKPDEDAPEAGIHNQRDRRKDGPVRIKYQIQTLRKGEAKTKPEAFC